MSIFRKIKNFILRRPDIPTEPIHTITDPQRVSFLQNQIENLEIGLEFMEEEGMCMENDKVAEMRTQIKGYQEELAKYE